MNIIELDDLIDWAYEEVYKDQKRSLNDERERKLPYTSKNIVLDIFHHLIVHLLYYDLKNQFPHAIHNFLKSYLSYDLFHFLFFYTLWDALK